MLVVISGLPATGKSSVSRIVAAELSAPYVRIDTLERALARAGAAGVADGTLGYVVGYAIAEDLLRQGFPVFAESVNPLGITRSAWRAVAERADVPCVEVEFVCSDPAEHKQRALSRCVDIPDLVLPNWQEIQQREYEPWDREHVVIDTAGRSLDECVMHLRTVVQSTTPS